MNGGDRLVERASVRLGELAEKAAARGGPAAKLAQPLAEDSAFVRKLKPSLIKARATGNPADDVVSQEPPRLEYGSARKEKGDEHGEGRNPLPILGLALAAGVVAARFLDWRGHAHPRL